MKQLLMKNNKLCQGCEACASVCPTSAIAMIQNEEGFYEAIIDKKKCIECGKCRRVCPQINYSKVNDENAKCYAVYANKDIRKKSSSGGAFSVIAEYVLNRGGVVCGAAFEADFRSVSHIMITKRDELGKIRKSKYVYCSPKNIYKQIIQELEKDTYVLFASTPCQVAALNNIIGKKYEKLITVDLLCAGVSSPMVWERYVDEVTKGKELKNVDFRDKDYGWKSFRNIKFIYKDGKVQTSNDDMYSKCFLNKVTTNRACFDCQYATYPRCADFTIGDFWSIEKFLHIDTDLGVSCITLNDEKAKEIFKEIQEKFEYMKEMPLDFLKNHNNTWQHRKENLARKRFFDLVNERQFPIKKAMEYSIGWKFDVAISGCWTVPNYGGEISYFALYNAIKSMGKTVIMVERRADIEGYDIPRPNGFRNNPYPYYDVSKIQKSFKEQQELNSRVENFVLGSDQTWNYNLIGNHSSVMSWSFDYVTSEHRKIAYAASFGANYFKGTDEEKVEFGKNLASFNDISLREASGIKLVKEIAGRDAVCVMDPVFLCDKNVYIDLAAKSNCRSNNHIFSYILHPEVYETNRIDRLTDIADKLGLDLRVVITLGKQLNNIPVKNTFGFSVENNCSVEDWLYLLLNSKYVVTTSFHAVCFSIIFHKPFIFVQGAMTDEHGFDRLRTLLEKCDLMNRVFWTLDDAFNSEKIFEEIDWDNVYKKINPEIQKSKEWLEKALNSPIKTHGKTNLQSRQPSFDEMKYVPIEEYDRVNNSISYRLGLAETYLPRKLYKMIKNKK